MAIPRLSEMLRVHVLQLVSSVVAPKLRKTSIQCLNICGRPDYATLISYTTKILVHHAAGDWIRLNWLQV